jgi:serine/threonine-protein kinase
MAAVPTARDVMPGHAAGAPVAARPVSPAAEPGISVPWPGGTPNPPAHEPTFAGHGIMRTASRGATNRAPAIVQPTAAPVFAIPGYNILKLLGRGGMGEVYLAERLSEVGVAVPCVIKTILSGSDTDPTMRQLFLDEVRLVAALRHPNLVAIMDVGQVHDRLYQTIEWVEGMDLEGMAEKGSRIGEGIPLKHLLYLFREALQGLHYVHSAKGPTGQPLGIVHRDISPGNILISRQGAVKIADFGVALMTAGKSGGDMDLAGKPHYFAPELWKGSPASVQTDIFAMGVTFYEMLSLKPLFQRSGTLRDIAQEIIRFDPRVLIENDLTIPEGIETLLMRSLAPDPRSRYATALEFLEDVNDYAYEFGIRLLDAHFAAWVQRLIDGPSQDIRKPLFRG